MHRHRSRRSHEPEILNYECAVCSAAALAFMLALACGGGSGSQFNPNGVAGAEGATIQALRTSSEAAAAGAAPAAVGADGGCLGLQCQIHARVPASPMGPRSPGTSTIPAGNNVLYKVAAYVPNNDPSPITDGINSGSCSCDALYTGNPIAAGISQPDGSFTIKNAPDGESTSRSSFRSASGEITSPSPPSRTAVTTTSNTLLPAKRRSPRRRPRRSSRTSRTSPSRRGARTRSSASSRASACRRASMAVTRRTCRSTFTSSRVRRGRPRTPRPPRAHRRALGCTRPGHNRTTS